MSQQKEIWVLPEIKNDGQEISKLSLGLLSEARNIAKKVGGSVIALVLGDHNNAFPKIMQQYGVDKTYVFKHPLLKRYSLECYSMVLSAKIKTEKPWLMLMGHTTAGKELGPRLAVSLGTGVVSNCLKIDLSDIESPKYYRPIYNGQAFQEIIFETKETMVVTLNTGALNVIAYPGEIEPKSIVVEPELSSECEKARHIGLLPADFKTVDITDADVIVAAGLGTIGKEVFPLIEELAILIEGSIGTTRPVVDEGRVARERMIGQTGKIVSPRLYLGLGISGATHHIAGIQESGTIISLNKDPEAPIFQNSDVGVVADLKDILPGLIEKIRQAKKDGKNI
jgi:electron transfer flavoprotein alpha subunit